MPWSWATIGTCKHLYNCVITKSLDEFKHTYVHTVYFRHTCPTNLKPIGTWGRDRKWEWSHRYIYTSQLNMALKITRVTGFYCPWEELHHSVQTGCNCQRIGIRPGNRSGRMLMRHNREYYAKHALKHSSSCRQGMLTNGTRWNGMVFQ